MRAGAQAPSRTLIASQRFASEAWLPSGQNPLGAATCGIDAALMAHDALRTTFRFGNIARASMPLVHMSRRIRHAGAKPPRQQGPWSGVLSRRRRQCAERMSGHSCFWWSGDGIRFLPKVPLPIRACERTFPCSNDARPAKGIRLAARIGACRESPAKPCAAWRSGKLACLLPMPGQPPVRSRPGHHRVGRDARQGEPEDAVPGAA